MAPAKFGLFKARSRDQDPPSTENLLLNSGSSEQVASPNSPIPSTSKGASEYYSPDATRLSTLQLDSDDEDIGSENTTPTRRVSSHSSVTEDSQMIYQNLTNQSTSELRHDDTERQLLEDNDDSTSCDANSIAFDESSIAPSEDISVYCLKKNKKNMKNRDMQIMRDLDMWRASDVEVMQNLLSRSSNQNDQFKWEAIATARGLCTLTDSCTCPDCKRAKYLAGVADGDGGLGAAPFIGAVTGCVLQ